MVLDTYCSDRFMVVKSVGGTSTIFISLAENIRPFFASARILNVRFGKNQSYGTTNGTYLEYNIPSGLWQPEANVQTQELRGLARGEQAGVAEFAKARDNVLVF